MNQSIDSIELEVFKHLFASVAEEMGIRLMRSAYSPNIKERRDYSCAIFDAKGDMIAQAAHIPVHLGSCPLSVKAIINRFESDGIKANDRFIVNDPFAGGTHLPDITVVAGIFIDDEPVPRFYVCNRAHHADIGGLTPGSLPISSHIDEEGVRIAPSCITNKLLEEIAQQSRTPEERLGDLQAQLAALNVGIERLQEMCGKYGKEKITQLGGDLQTYTATYTKQIINQIPRGTYCFTDYMDDDGHGHCDLSIEVAITIKDHHATIDFRGTAKQTLGPVNAVKAITQSAVMYCFRCLADEEIPSNSGVLQPITIVTEPGTIVDAQYPAAVAGGNVETSQRIVDAVFGALSKAIPDRIPAASQGTMNNVTIGSLADCKPDDAFAYYETIAGGSGATASSNGADAIHTHMTNTLNTPVEALEHAYPFRIGQYEIRVQSGLENLSKLNQRMIVRHGGAGLVREYIFDQDAIVTLLTERRLRPPYSLPISYEPDGICGLNRIHKADNKSPEELRGKVSLEVKTGDRLQIFTPGGGHYYLQV